MKDDREGDTREGKKNLEKAKRWVKDRPDMQGREMEEEETGQKEGGEG